MSSESNNPTQEEVLEILRRSVQLRVDRAGLWFHDGEPFSHPRIARVFSEGLGLHPDSGEAIVTIGERFCYVECDGTPFLVQRVAFAEGEAHATLNTGETVTMSRDGLYESEGRVALRIDARRWARLSRGVYERLADALVEVDAGYAFSLPTGLYHVATAEGA